MRGAVSEINGKERMNKDMFISETRNTPEIRFNSVINEWTISGKSYPRNVSEVYEEIKNWIDNIEVNQVKCCSLHFKLEFFNTITSQFLINMLLKLSEKKRANDLEVKVNWYYESDDDDMRETGESMMVVVGLPFEMVCM